MRKTKHTRGPWKYVRDSDYWEIKPTGIGGKDNYEGNEADYLLIAAAPDLLASLKCFLEDDRFQVAVGGNPIVVDAMLAAARAAIAAATHPTTQQKR